MKKVLGETQTLHSGCSEAEPKIFAPPQTPFPGARDGQNLINITTFTCRVQTQFGESRGNRPTNKHTHTHKHRPPATHRTDNNTPCR